MTCPKSQIGGKILLICCKCNVSVGLGLERFCWQMSKASMKQAFGELQWFFRLWWIISSPFLLSFNNESLSEYQKFQTWGRDKDIIDNDLTQECLDASFQVIFFSWSSEETGQCSDYDSEPWSLISNPGSISWPWKCHLPSLCLSFLKCIVKVIRALSPGVVVRTILWAADGTWYIESRVCTW